MHEMQPIATDDPGVCQSLCHAAPLCKHGWTTRGPVWGKDHRWPKNHKTRVPTFFRCGLPQITSASWQLLWSKDYDDRGVLTWRPSCWSMSFKSAVQSLHIHIHSSCMDQLNCVRGEHIPAVVTLTLTWWVDDLDTRTWPRYSENVHLHRKLRCYVE